MCVPGPHPRCHTTFSCHVLLGCDSFWDFPCSWWFWQFWGVLVGYLIGCHCIRICLFFFFMITLWLRVFRGRPQRYSAIFIIVWWIFLKNLFIYFWLFWVLIAARRLFLVEVIRAFSSLQCMGSRLTGFHCCILQQEGSIIVVHRLSFSAARGIFPDKGWNLGPLHWECRVLATGPPRKSLLPITVDLSKIGTWLRSWLFISFSL